MLSHKALNTPLNEIDIDLFLQKNINNIIFLGNNEFFLLGLKMEVYHRDYPYESILIPFEKRVLNIECGFSVGDNSYYEACIYIKLSNIEDQSISIENILAGLQNNNLVCDMNFRFLETNTKYRKGPKVFENIRFNQNAIQFDGWIYSVLLDQNFRAESLQPDKIEYYFNLDIAQYISEIPRVISSTHLWDNEIVLGGLKWKEESFSYDRDINEKFVQIAKSQRRAVVPTDYFDPETRKPLDKVVKHHPSNDLVIQHLTKVFIKDDKWNMDISSKKAIHQQISDERGKFIRDYSNNMEIL